MEITANAAANSSSVLNAAVSRSKNDTVEGNLKKTVICFSKACFSKSFEL